MYFQFSHPILPTFFNLTDKSSMCVACFSGVTLLVFTLRRKILLWNDKFQH